MKKYALFFFLITCVMLVSCQETNKIASEISPTLTKEISPTVTPTIMPTKIPTPTAMPLVNAVPEDELLYFVDSKTDLVGFIKNNGEWIIPAQFYVASRFQINKNFNDWAWVFITEEDYTNGNRKLIDDKGTLSDFDWDKLIIEYELDFAPNGLSVKKDPVSGKDGYVNDKGDWVISPTYETAFKFSDNGLARVQVEVPDETGFLWTETYFIDQNGTRKTPNYSGLLGDFTSNGLAYNCVNGHSMDAREFEFEMLSFYFGVDESYSDDLYIKMLTFQGEYELYDNTTDTLGDYAAVNHGKNAWIDRWVLSLSKVGFYYCGYIDETGEFAIPVKFLDAGIFNNAGYAFVQDVWSEGLWGVIDSTGEFVVEPSFVTSSDYEIGLLNKGAAKNEEGLWGFIDDKGIYFIQPQFAEVRSFNDADVAWVKTSDNLWGLINREGEYIIEPAYYDVRVMSDESSIYWVQTTDELWGLVDSTKSYWIEPQFKEVSHIYEKYGIALVKTTEEEWFYVNYQGAPIIGDGFAVPVN